MNDTDKLTLELFTNKTQYKKYLSKIEPDNYNEIRVFREKCVKYKDEILNKTEKLLLLSDDYIYNFMNNPFYKFTNEIIKEIELEIQKKNENDIYENNFDFSYDAEEEEDDDDDVLFPSDKMIDTPIVEKHSFWGKERVIQQNSNSDFIAHYPTNMSVRRRFVGRRNSILPKDA